MEFVIRQVVEEEIPIVLQFIREIAEYERMSDQVIATEELLREWLFEKKIGEVLIASHDGQDVGFALYFYNFSTFMGRAGLYLEDIFVRPEYRGHGLGKLFFRKLAQIAVQRGCGRMEWTCLNWNTPSIAFYESMGAIPMKDWTVHRLTGENLRKLAEECTES